MSEHKATLLWKRTSHDFAYKTYNREHTWTFDGGVVVRASAAPAYLGQPDHVDPEEAFVASIASCHMLTFLAIASKRKFVVDGYQDHASGIMEKNENGALAITKVTLRPQITFADAEPDASTLQRMHHDAHKNCFIANSVSSEITIAT